MLNQRFPGQVFDAETGLIQNGYREYNPRIGRYVESDPIGLKAGINTYSYVHGNPVNSIDPTGLTSVNTIDRKEDFMMWLAAELYPDEPGFMIIHSHGSYMSVNGMPIDKLPDYLRAKGWKAGMPIILNACNTGNRGYDGSDSIAQKLARLLKTEVYAPFGPVDNWGPIDVGPIDGGWRKFEPNAGPQTGPLGGPTH